MTTSSAPNPRRVAVDALGRIEVGGAYANVMLPRLLDRSGLDRRDRALVTELVYGTTRMRRACDFAVDRFLVRAPSADLRTILRLGAYQLLFTDIPPHAAVGETVSLAPKRVSGFVNAVLRKVSQYPPEWPDAATKLSYPDWIVERLGRELGNDAPDALAKMNEAPPVSVREDGYTQDLSSQFVAAAVEAEAHERVLDLCAAPGGKATALAHTGARVVAADVQPNRMRLVTANIASLNLANIDAVAADATRPPFATGSFDRVLLDAPCSGLGALRRRADARWRVTPNDVDELAVLQRQMIEAAVTLVRPGGVLIYSVCTLTAAESIDHDRAGVVPETWERLAPPSTAPWRTWDRGARLFPHDADSDGMAMLRWRRPG